MARLGGDEFALLLVRCGEGGGEVEVANRIVREVAELSVDYPGAGIGASVGVMRFDEPPGDAEQAIMLADRAMYEAKSAGKGRARSGS